VPRPPSSRKPRSLPELLSERNESPASRRPRRGLPSASSCSSGSDEDSGIRRKALRSNRDPLWPAIGGRRGLTIMQSWSSGSPQMPVPCPGPSMRPKRKSYTTNQKGEPLHCQLQCFMASKQRIDSKCK
jgi:hypothetical protein